MLPPCPSSFHLTQTYFELNLYPNNLVPIILLVHMTYEVGTDSVPKQQHKELRQWGVTQKKEHNILPVTYILTICIFITHVLLLFYPCKSYCAAFFYSCIVLYRVIKKDGQDLKLL
jgi:TRAP-type C4-dicarboxylate transport system permease large subunit